MARNYRINCKIEWIFNSERIKCALKTIERYIRFRIKIIISKYENEKWIYTLFTYMYLHFTVIGIRNLCFAFNGSESFECEMLFVITALRGRVREWLWRHRIAWNVGSNDYFISRWNSMNIIMSFTASASLLFCPSNLTIFETSMETHWNVNY